MGLCLESWTYKTKKVAPEEQVIEEREQEQENNGKRREVDAYTLKIDYCAKPTAPAGPGPGASAGPGPNSRT